MIATHSPHGRVGAPAELEHDRAAAVDHEVEPAVVARHGEALVGQRRRHAHADQPHPRRRHHLPPYHRRTAGKIVSGSVLVTRPKIDYSMLRFESHKLIIFKAEVIIQVAIPCLDSGYRYRGEPSFMF